MDINLSKVFHFATGETNLSTPSIGVEHIFHQLNRKRVKSCLALLLLHFLLFPVYLSYPILLKYVFKSKQQKFALSFPYFICIGMHLVLSHLSYIELNIETFLVIIKQYLQQYIIHLYHKLLAETVRYSITGYKRYERSPTCVSVVSFCPG